MAVRTRRRAVAAMVLSAIIVASASGCTAVVDGRPSLASAPTHDDLAKVVLNGADLSSDWVVAATTTASRDPDLDADLAACLKVRFDASSQVAKAESAEFRNGADEVSSAATSFRTQTEADVRLAALRRPGADGCLAAALRTQLGSGLPSPTHVTDVAVRVLGGGIVLGVSTTVHAVITFTALGQSAQIWVDVAYLRARQTVVTLAFTGVQGQVPADVQSTLTTAVLTRARRV